MASAIHAIALSSGATAHPLTSPASAKADSAASFTPGENLAGALRVVFDPLAGLVVEYLNGKGVVQSQIPSSAAVAYIHAGLMSTGLPRSVTVASPPPAVHKVA